MDNKIDIQEEILLHIDSERTRAHTIEWSRLKIIGDSLQELILSIAEANAGYSIDKANESLILEAMPFKEGSYVPAFKIKGDSMSFFEDNVLDDINSDFNKIAEIAGKGQYGKILDLYPKKEAGATVGEALYKFHNSFDGMPVSFAEAKNGKIKDLYPVKQFKRVDKLLIAQYLPDKKRHKSLIIKEGLAKVRISKFEDGRISRKITEFYPNTDAVASIKLENIAFNDRHYVFNSPLFLEEGSEESFPYLKSEILDIYANGDNIDEALADFYEDFDYLYRRLFELSDNELGEKMLKAKRYLELTVKNIENVSTESNES